MKKSGNVELYPVKGSAPSLPIPDHQGGPVAVTFESKLCANGTLVSHLPQHGGLYLPIEHGTFVNA